MSRPAWVRPAKLDGEGAHEPIRSRAPSSPKRPRPAAASAAAPKARAKAAPSPKPAPKPARKPRPITMDSVSLGEVEVIRATDKGIQVVGGDTTGENWLPRSYILDPDKEGGLDRDAEAGDRGEIWLPSWLANKVPW